MSQQRVVTECIYLFLGETGEEGEIWHDEKERRREKAHKEPRKREKEKYVFFFNCYVIRMQAVVSVGYRPH